MAEYRRVVALEKQAIYDVSHFRETLSRLSPERGETLVAFFSRMETPELQADAFAFMVRLPPDQAVAYCDRFRSARLPGLRRLAE
jgi:hypothetical protein